MQATAVLIPTSEVNLDGELRLPPDARGLILFVHGSGSSRHSPRNQFVARELNKAQLGTLLFDLLTPQEERAEARTRHLRFDIPMLAKRLMEVTRWVLAQPAPAQPLGYFGASTGAAAALVAAAENGSQVRAIVSRGGRPDLAADALPRVTASTLLIVGSDDEPVIELNQQAYHRLRCQKTLEIVPGASHLFEEPGKLEIVASLASQWFSRYLNTPV